MLRNLLLVFFLSSSLFAKMDVLVSIAPTRYLVDRISGGEVKTEILVPTGASPHSYEPTAKQILDATSAKIWFRIGEGFETSALKVMPKEMVVVDLRENLPLLLMPCKNNCCKSYYDPHIWLSPRLLKMEASVIETALSNAFPAHSSLFKENLASLLNDLDKLDQEIFTHFQSHPLSSILVAHPSFGYFCHDYHINQFSIEADGKEPTPLYLSSLLNEAKKNQIDLVVISPQYDRKGALLLAKELKAEIVSLDPYKENVLENLKAITHALSRS